MGPQAAPVPPCGVCHYLMGWTQACVASTEAQIFSFCLFIFVTDLNLQSLELGIKKLLPLCHQLFLIQLHLFGSEFYSRKESMGHHAFYLGPPPNM